MEIDIDATLVQYDAGAEVAEHLHEQGQFSIVLRGSMTISGAEGWWLVPAGLSLWIPPTVVHSGHYSESAEVIHVRLSDGPAWRLPPDCATIVVTDLLRSLALEAVRLRKRADQAEALTLVMQLIVLHLREPQRGPGLHLPHGRDRRLQQATALLRADPGKNWSLNELAEKTFTSSRTLARLFVTETGMPFTRWRDQMRVISAIDKLSRRLSITQTALELGYQTTSSFTNFFTRVVGAPPRRYIRGLSRQQDSGDQ